MRDVPASEVASINELRAAVGLPLLVKKKRKCCMCGVTWETYNKFMLCQDCSSKVKEEGDDR